MTKQSYTYTILRYVHDVATGEFINVGVVLHDTKTGVVVHKLRKSLGRVRAAFPNADRYAYQAAIKSVERGIKKISKKSEPLFASNATSFARKVVQIDDSSLQWSPEGSGLAESLSVALERLYERYVSKYDRTERTRKTDEEVWKPVRERLVAKGIPVKFEPKVVVGKTDEIEFRHAWKNGTWHAYEPVSLDLADPENIKDKARKWRGHLAAVADDGVLESVQVSFIVGAPGNSDLQPAYAKAIEILKKAPKPFAPRIYEERDLDRLIDDIEDEARAHG